ncbi:uncharacterized protein [Rutidosis leptorrhynchoides]|uniref:uncharacterized protein n=1 Tax=Rutidosis leptorrhynchoides TaxID=125765 RepID=UPI003A9A21D9
MKQRLPVRTELDKRGVDLHSVRCPMCDEDLETAEHTLINCKFAKDVWNRVYKWWNINSVSAHTLSNAFKENCILGTSKSGKYIWQALKWTCGYLLWKNRNSREFKGDSWTVPLAVNEIQIMSFDWIARRIKGDWMKLWFYNGLIMHL